MSRQICENIIVEYKKDIKKNILHHVSVENCAIIK
jgi:hypothetical protein